MKNSGGNMGKRLKAGKPLRQTTPLRTSGSIKKTSPLSGSSWNKKPSLLKKGLKPTPKKPKLKSVSKLKKEADALWSKYIRYRDGKLVGGEWQTQCITCDQWLPMKSMQCGHFISRSHNILRFDEENTNGQCYADNVMRYGEQYKYGLALDLKYGEGTARKLLKMSQDRHQFTREELEQIKADAKALIAYYETSA